MKYSKFAIFCIVLALNGCSWASKEIRLEIENQNFMDRAQITRSFGIEANKSHLREAQARWPSLSGTRLHRRALALAATQKNKSLHKEVLQLGKSTTDDIRALEILSQTMASR